MDRLDIRVHVSAGSTSDADRDYEVQAVAYLAFSAASVKRLSTEAKPHDIMIVEQDQIEAVELRPAQVDEAHDHLEKQTAFLSDTQLAISALDSQLFSIPPSPLVRPNKRAHQAITRSPDKPTWTTKGIEGTSEESRESNSSYLRTPVIRRSNKKRRLQDDASTLQQTTTNITVAKSIVRTPDRRLLPVARPEVSSQDYLRHSSSSQLPTTYSLSDITSDKTKSDRSLQRSVSDPGPNAAASVDASTVSELNSPLLLRRIEGATGLPQSAVADELVPVENRAPAVGNTECSLRMMRCPPPEVSIDHFESHVTRHLRELVDDSRTERLYHPTLLKRELRPLERGYWRFCSRSWSPAFRERFWDFLDEFISNGRAGWGVWCAWTTGDNEDSHMMTVYCWAECVKHIYLLLYVASQSKIRRLGLQWLDAEDQIIIQMRG